MATQICEHDACDGDHAIPLGGSWCRDCEDNHANHSECCWCGEMKDSYDSQALMDIAVREGGREFPMYHEPASGIAAARRDAQRSTAQ